MTASTVDAPLPYWDTQRAARYYGVTPRTVQRWAAAGHLTARRLGRCWLIDIDPDELENTHGPE